MRKRGGNVPVKRRVVVEPPAAVPQQLDLFERWLPVPGYEGLYEVSDHGNVRSQDRRVRCGRGWRIVPGQVIQQHSLKGYLRVGLWCERKLRWYRIGRLVLLTFQGPPPEPGMEAGHIRPDRSDNRLENLAWVTRDANQEEMRGRRYSVADYVADSDWQAGASSVIVA